MKQERLSLTERMQRIRKTNTKPEMIVRRLIHPTLPPRQARAAFRAMSPSEQERVALEVLEMLRAHLCSRE